MSSKAWQFTSTKTRLIALIAICLGISGLFSWAGWASPRVLAALLQSSATIQLSAATFTVAETGGVVSITVSRTGATDGIATVDYATSDDTANSGADYKATSGTLRFDEGETSKTINIFVIDDAASEAPETFNLTLSNPFGNSTLGNPNAAVLTITSNDANPSISIKDVAVVERGPGTPVANFLVTLSSASSQTITVNYATANDTATIANNDYTAASGTLTFSPGEVSKIVAVNVTVDTTLESNETFNVNLTSPTNATIQDSLGVGTIINDDFTTTPTVATIQLATNSYTVNEASNSITFTVLRHGRVNNSVSVNYTTNDGTATLSGNDYTGSIDTLQFTFNQLSGTITIPINNDNIAETIENFSLT